MTEHADLDVDEWDTAGDGEPVDEQAAEPLPQLYFPSVDVFVRDHLAPTYRRGLDGRNRTWCPQWWRHPEAIARLEAIWRAWEHLRLDPATGISIWLRDHADHHMTVLLDPDGPFKGCSPEKGHSTRLEPLPVEDPPTELFTPAGGSAVKLDHAPPYQPLSVSSSTIPLCPSNRANQGARGASA